MLHIHCGDSSAGSLRQAGVPGEVIVWMDLLHEGPTPAGVSPAEWRDLRAALLAGSSGHSTVDAMRAHLEAQDEALKRFPAHEEVVLWFDACLYDQLHLIRHLDWFSGRETRGTRLSLLCVGEFPGLPRFRGLGELSPEQLASLLPARHAVTLAETRLAQEAWAAFRAPDPRAIEAVLAADTSALPYLGDALRRHLQQFPSTRSGLNRVEAEILDVVAAGCRTPAEVFVRTSEKEERPFFGDSTLWLCMEALAAGSAPALRIEGPGPLPRFDAAQHPPLKEWRISLTESGAEFLAGRADWVARNGLDRWLGGVHLHAGAPLWRWDEDAGRLTT